MKGIHVKVIKNEIVLFTDEPKYQEIVLLFDTELCAINFGCAVIHQLQRYNSRVIK